MTHMKGAIHSIVHRMIVLDCASLVRRKHVREHELHCCNNPIDILSNCSWNELCMKRNLLRAIWKILYIYIHMHIYVSCKIEMCLKFIWTISRVMFALIEIMTIQSSKCIFPCYVDRYVWESWKCRMHRTQ